MTSGGPEWGAPGGHLRSLLQGVPLAAPRSPGFLSVLRASHYPPSMSLRFTGLQEPVSVGCTCCLSSRPLIPRPSLPASPTLLCPGWMGYAESEGKDRVGGDHCSTSQVIGTGLHILTDRGVREHVPQSPAAAAETHRRQVSG